MGSSTAGDPAEPPIIGWDVGGVNLKAARLAGGALTTTIEPFELQRAPDRLPEALAALARRLHATPADRHGITMTAELSQFFRTKREGVAFVLDAVAAALPGAALHVWGTDGRFHPPERARTEPLRAAASNWMATAAFVALYRRDAILLDVGSTTADIIPIVNGSVAALGRTDPERLGSGELIYTGALRTPIEAVVRRVPLAGGEASVSAEGFALTGDLHLWLGNLTADDYTVNTPDGRPASREFAGERLARVVCGDRETLSEADIDRLARAVAESQIDDIAGATRRVRERHPELGVAVVAGLGDFIASAAARRAGLRTLPLGDLLGRDAARAAPAAAVAHLLERWLRTTQA